MKAIIMNNNEWGGNCTDEHIENNESLFLDCFFTDVLPNNNIIKKIWNGTEWIEGATPQEILEASKPKIPEEISRMKFKIQIRRSTIYSYDIILTYLQNLAVNELFTQDDKDELIDRLEDAVSFNRYHKDFINLANMLSVSDEIKDEIFIEGNKIQ